MNYQRPFSSNQSGHGFSLVEIVVAVVAVALIAAGGYVYLNHNHQSQTTTTAQASPTVTLMPSVSASNGNATSDDPQVNQDLNSVDSQMSQLSQDDANTTKGLNDQQGNLSEN